MQTSVSDVERIVLSHWHSDHSGGILSFLKHRQHLSSSGTASPSSNSHPKSKSIVVDLHPSRPTARGIAPPPGDKVIARLKEDPHFSELKALGAEVELSKDGHVVAGEGVYVSGEIPRVSEFEGGLIGGMRWEEGKGWFSEPVSMNVAYLMLKSLG